MSIEPCKLLEEAYLAAMKEHVDASRDAQEFAAREIDPLEDLEPHPNDYLDRMRSAFKRRREAEKKYFSALEEYMVCLEQFRNT